jgi:TRAP-type C4-dicarboxylate transport system permease small subunit
MMIIAGVILIFMAGLTLLDVIMRYFGKPIVGTYELVSFLGLAAVAFSLPRSSLMGAHVYVDLVVDKLPTGSRKLFRVFTRFLVFLLFLIASWYFFHIGMDLIATKTVTMSLKVPFYPVVFALAAGCLAQCLVSVCEILSAMRRTP